MKEEAVIVKVEGDKAVIETVPKDECRKCSCCGLARPININAADIQGLKEGDHVTIDVSSSEMMKIYLLLYVFPLIVFVSGILILYAFFRNPLISFSGALLATILAYVGVGRYVKTRTVFSPRICARR